LLDQQAKRRREWEIAIVREWLIVIPRDGEPELAGDYLRKRRGAA
jgi:hypothetical protein